MKDISAKMVATFVAGLILGGVIVWFLFCCKKDCHENIGKGPNLPEPVLIDVSTANAYFSTYMLSPDTVSPFKAFAVNLMQYNAMKKILEVDTTVKGFRIYMGAADTTKSGRVSIVVGFGTPDHTATVYSTDMEDSGTCPFICDEDSPIVTGR